MLSSVPETGCVPSIITKLYVAAETECITVANVASTMVTMMVNNPLAEIIDFSSLRVLSCGGSPQSRAIVVRAIALFGCQFFLSYGMTECCGKISMSILPEDCSMLSEEEKLDLVCSSGRPFQLINLRIVDDDGKDVPRDGKTVGEVLISGHTVFKGYVGLPEANMESFDGDWFHTGDLAVARPDGYISVVDRKKDMLLVGGENVYTTEVEDVLHSHPGVHQAAVFGVENKVMGELVMGAVTIKPDFSVTRELGKELVAWCRSRLADYKVPIAVQIVDSFPTTGSGKIMKTELRKMFSGSSSRDTGVKEDLVYPSNASGLAAYISTMAGGSLDVMDIGKKLSDYGPRIIRGASYLFITRTFEMSAAVMKSLCETAISHLIIISLQRPDDKIFDEISLHLANVELVVLYLPASLLECKNDRLVRTALSAARHKVPSFGGILYDSTSDDIEKVTNRSENLANVVMNVFSSILDKESLQQVSQGEPFMASGVTSTLAVQVVGALEDALGVSIPGTAIFDYPTLDDMVSFLGSETSTPDAESNQESSLRKQVRPMRAVADTNNTIRKVQVTQNTESITLEVNKIISEATGEDLPDPDAPLMSLGVNSTMAVQLVARLEELAGEELPGTLVFDYPTVNEIAEYISSIGPAVVGSVDEQVLSLAVGKSEMDTCGITSIAGIVPGGDLEYTNYKNNDRITIVPLERWDIDQAPTDNQKELNLQFGSFVEGAEMFDARMFNISPAEALLMDPQQRLLITYFNEAWSVHCKSHEFSRDTGIFVGVSQLDYARIAYETGSALNTYYATGSHLSVTSGRISYCYGFKGPAMTVDTACSSSLVSTHLAANAMYDRSCGTCATLGTNLALVHSWTRACLRAGMLADDGRCKTLDASAGEYN